MGKSNHNKNRGSRLAYAFWAGLLAGIPLAFIYYYSIRPMPPLDGMKWVWIFIAVSLTGLIGSWVARSITRYGKFKLTGQFVMTNLISDVFYSTIIWMGLLGLLVDTQPLPQLVLIYVFIRVLLFFVADYLADKITFGG